MGNSLIIIIYALRIIVSYTTARRNILFNKWVLVNDFENYLDTSQLLWVKDGISLLTCCSLCDMDQSCRTFFYNPSLNKCLGSQSYKRGLPPGQTIQQEWKYYTKAPTCDGDYILNKTLGFCYKIHTEMRTFTEALDVCEEEGAKPIIIRDEMEILHVQNFIIDAAGPGFRNFIGLRKIVSNATIIWKWWNGHEASYINWWPGEPNNKNEHEDCVEFVIDVDDQYKYNDVDCLAQKSFICQKNI